MLEKNTSTNESNALMLRSNASTLARNSLKLETTHAQLSTIQSGVSTVLEHVSIGREVVVARTSGYATSGTPRRGCPTCTTICSPPSTELVARVASFTDADIFTVVRDAMVVFRRFIAAGEIRVPLMCSVLLSMSMSTDLPILTRMLVSNMIVFFMWKQVLMPRRVTFMVTFVTFTRTRVEVPLSAIRNPQVCQFPECFIWLAGA